MNAKSVISIIISVFLFMISIVSCSVSSAEKSELRRKYEQAQNALLAQNERNEELSKTVSSLSAELKESKELTEAARKEVDHYEDMLVEALESKEEYDNLLAQAQEEQAETDRIKQEEEAKRAAEEEKARSVEGKKANATKVSWDDLYRYNEKYKSEMIKCTIKITDIDISDILGVGLGSESYLGSLNGKDIAVYDKRKTKEPMIREGDTVTIYGYSDGLSVLKHKQKGLIFSREVDEEYIPSVGIEYVDIN